jgi:competence protein ComEA
MKFIVFLVTTVSFLFAAVDINNASAKELTSLKGVGEKRAASILAYRKQHCFKSVDEITLIKGIGKKTLEKNRDNMETGSCD